MQSSKAAGAVLCGGKQVLMITICIHCVAARAVMLFALIPLPTIRSMLSKHVEGSSYGKCFSYPKKTVKCLRLGAKKKGKFSLQSVHCIITSGATKRKGGAEKLAEQACHVQASPPLLLHHLFTEFSVHVSRDYYQCAAQRQGK